MFIHFVLRHVLVVSCSFTAMLNEGSRQSVGVGLDDQIFPLAVAILKEAKEETAEEVPGWQA